jgi:hypothetical protein
MVSVSICAFFVPFVRTYQPGRALVPLPVPAFGGEPQLDDQIAGAVLWLQFAPLFSPLADKRCLIVAHDDPCIGAKVNRTAATLIGVNQPKVSNLCELLSIWMRLLTALGRRGRRLPISC